MGLICAKGYIGKLEDIKAGRLTHPNVSFEYQLIDFLSNLDNQFTILILNSYSSYGFSYFSIKEIVSPPQKHINIGMIMVTLEDVRQKSHES